jgi:hypothetical protein
MWATLEHHTSLKRLNVAANEWQLGSVVALPFSLTHLGLSCIRGDKLPAQVKF